MSDWQPKVSHHHHHYQGDALDFNAPTKEIPIMRIYATVSIEADSPVEFARQLIDLNEKYGVHEVNAVLPPRGSTEKTSNDTRAEPLPLTLREICTTQAGITRYLSDVCAYNGRVPIEARLKVTITYPSSAGVRTTRTVTPSSMIKDGLSHPHPTKVGAFDHSAEGQYKTFLISRIRTVEGPQVTL